MEGFVKALKKNNLQELKKYFFYLTYDERADKEIINKKTIESKYNKNIEIKQLNPIKTYWDYRNAIKQEWKQNRIKSLELIMSYSKEFNYIMKNALGIKKWETIYKNIIKNIINKNSKSKINLLYFHKMDKTGYRYHVHVILYPYYVNKSNESLLYTHIEKKVLNTIKQDFNNYAIELSKKYENEIKKFLISKVEGEIENEKLFFQAFSKMNPKLSNYLGFLELKD